MWKCVIFPSHGKSIFACIYISLYHGELNRINKTPTCGGLLCVVFFSVHDFTLLCLLKINSLKRKIQNIFISKII